MIEIPQLVLYHIPVVCLSGKIHHHKEIAGFQPIYPSKSISERYLILQVEKSKTSTAKLLQGKGSAWDAMAGLVKVKVYLKLIL